MSDGPVTILISRQVQSGREAEFEAILREWIPRLVQFPGHLGALIVQPIPPACEYGAVLRFASPADWNAFQQWDQYAAFLERLRPLLAEAPRTERLTGMEAWFQRSGLQEPPRWKMALLTWVGVSLTVGVLSLTLGPLMANWSWLANLLVMNALIVAALTWAVMPILTKAAGAWLKP